MKLIIDIPEHILDTIQADEMLSRVQLSVLQMHILKGTPLDDVKAEIVNMEYHMIDCEVLVSQDEVLQILDNIGKESEGTND